MASRQLRVEIIGDSRSLQKALGSATDSTGKLGKAFSVLGKAAAGAGVAVAAGFVYTLKRGFDELGEAQKVSAQTAAGIKSTGAAAKVTAKQVEGLAQSLSLMSGVDDEVIQQGENLLLTFTKVRNEVGKGNDVFNRATAAALDLSVRGFGSMDSTSKMLGKALQDPIKGMTALGKAGVTFTAEQKETIKGLVETGKQLQAQKLILKEVETQVGGSAKAYGETLPGQLAKLRNAFDEVAAKLAARLLPALTEVVDSINENWPQIERVATRVMDVLVSAVGTAVSTVRTHFNTIKTVVTTTFGAAKSIIQGFASFFRSDFGQSFAVGAAGVYGIATALRGLTAAASVARVALAAISLNPILLALIPVGAALGALGKQFINSKLEAMAWEAALRGAAGAARDLKTAADALTGSEIALTDAKLRLRETTTAATQAEVAYNKAKADSGAKSKEATTAQLAYKQATNDLARAKNDLSTAEDTHRAKLVETKTALADSAAGVDDARSKTEAITKSTLGFGEALKNPYGAFVTLSNLIASDKSLEQYAASQLGAGNESLRTARKLMESQPAYAAASQKIGLMQLAAAELTFTLNEVPKKEEIIARAKIIGDDMMKKGLLAIPKAANQARDETKSAMDRIPQDMRTVAGEAGAAASGIGSAITSGISAGFNFGGVIDIVRDGVRRAIAAGANAGSTTKDYAGEKIGKPLTEGPIEQVKKDAPKLAEVTVASVRKAVGAAQLAAAAAEIGGPAVQKIINDIVGKTPSLKAQFATAVREAAEAGRQAIADAKQGWADAFASLFDAGAAAIAAKYADWKPPAFLKAQAEAEARAKAELIKAVTDAQRELRAAIAAEAAATAAAAVVTRNEGESDADFEARKAALVKAAVDAGTAVAAAQKTLDDAKFAKRQQHLAELAKTQQDAHDKEVAADIKKFGRLLGVIQSQYANHKITYEQMQAKIKTLLASFDIDFLNAGKAWGNSIAEGIRSARKAVENAAKELAQAAKDNTQNNSPKPKKGPLSRKSMFDAGREHGMNWARGIASAAGAVGKAAATTAGGASGGFGDAKNTGNIFDFGSGKEPPGGFGPDFEGSRPSWADRELWSVTAAMAAKLGKFDALIDAVTSGSIRANAGLLSQLFYARTRKTWNDFPARIARILDDMRGPEGLSSVEAAAKYGLKEGGYTKRDGFVFLHKNELVTPAARGTGGGTTIIVNANGVMAQDANTFARVVTPYIDAELRRSQHRGGASIVQAT